MTSVVLVDPGLVHLDPQSDRVVFWLRLTEWQQDKRTRLGPWTFDRYFKLYTDALATGSNLIPSSIARAVHRSIGDWLEHGPLVVEDISEDAALDHQYVLEACRDELIADIYSARTVSEVALGSDSDFWESPAPPSVGCTPPGVRLSTHYKPNTPTADEVRADRHARFGNTRIVIIGGQLDLAAIHRLKDELGIAQDQVRWIPSEPDKKPRNIDSVVQGASMSGALVLCVTGKVAHETMYETRDTCGKYGVVYLRAESPSGVLAAVCAHLNC